MTADEIEAFIENDIIGHRKTKQIGSNDTSYFEKISKILNDEGKTVVNINLVTEDNILKFKLKNTRKLDRKALNILRKEQIQALIS